MLKLKSFLFLILFFISSSAMAQDEFDPGFGDEGGSDAADAPLAPINQVNLPLLITGAILSFYLLKKETKRFH